ncbi:hypothetical protein SAY87_011536 [Trapa incisa]|uniref:DWNN domain-containing protein n=1 Tax=Trapa incisa TaxID=236973 RepID=A0AAN7JID5_9MYRT|nr:hypothetical protein SAY87_011536 [Trapa incisa]
MAVYYKFKSARDYDSVPMDGPFISVGALKEKIFESKHLGKGTDFDLLVTNAQTDEEYLDEATLIPKHTSVLIRRVPGRHRMPIVTEQEPKLENKVEDVQPGKGSTVGPDSSSMKYQEDSEWDEFGNDLYAIPEALPVQSNNQVLEIVPTSKTEEENKLKALINTPALDWQRQGADGFGHGRGSGRGGRMGRGFGLERKTPPPGYVCHRCNVPGHFIQHCPTNGDPNYDIKRVKPPTGIPKSMLMATPDGSYALPSGVVATLKPNEAAFEKEIEGLPSTRSIGELPPELHCPLCKEVMKDAVLTSKCCFNSFCDKCIREHIISKSMCVCGATNILADDLLPNKTLRDTISRILESGNSSAENAGSAFQVQDMESARGPQLKVPSPTLSSASEQRPPLTKVEETLNVNIAGNEVKDSSVPPQMSDKGKNVKVPDVSEATHESMNVREPTSQGSALLPDEEVQQKVVSGEAAKKKKLKKVRQPANDLQRRIPLDSAADNYMMPLGPSGFNPYWTGMQPAMDGFMGPYAGSFPSMPYNMGYGMGPMDMSFGVMPPHDPFSNQAYMSMMLPVPPQRDLSGFGMHMNAPPPPIMSREEFEARKADIRRKRENENQGERRETLRGRDYGRDKRGVGDGPSMSSKKSTMDAPPAELHPRQYPQRSERVSPDQTRDDLEPIRRGTKRRSTELNRDRERDHSSDYDYCDSHQDRPHGRSESAKRLTSSDPHHSRSESSKRPPSSDPHHSRSESSKRPPSSDPHHGRSESSKRLQSSDPHPGTSESSKRLPSSDPHRGRSETSKRLPSSDPAKPEPSSSTSAALDCKQKTSVFSRISFPENEPTKKPKISSSSSAEDPSLSTHHKDGFSVSNGHCDDHKSSSLKSAAASGSGAGGRKRSSRVDHESSDDERHFKRKPTKYEPTPSPPPSRPKEEGRRHSRGSRDRDHR